MKYPTFIRKIRRTAIFLIIICFIIFQYSCQEAEDFLTSINTQVTSEYLLNGDLTVYLQSDNIIRQKGKPGINSILIGDNNLSDYENCFILNIKNGSESIGTVSSAIVKLDGQVILNPSDFSNNTTIYKFEICNLSQQSALEVEVRGTPGSFLEIWIQGKLKNKTVTDINGNIYKTIEIGSQVWMAENMRTSRLNDGTEIKLVTDNNEWFNLKNPGLCWYDNTYDDNSQIYGALYNWSTVNTGTLCPDGWHVPTDAEWTSLTTYLGGISVAGGKLKEEGTSHWLQPNTGATNESGFMAVPGGNRMPLGTFINLGKTSQYWTSTQNAQMTSITRTLNNVYAGIMKTSAPPEFGLSVRCIKNAQEGDYDADSFTVSEGDCNDYDPAIHPGAEEICQDGIDQDCNGSDLICPEPISGEPITDIEGNTYNTVIIGTQTWMSENLKTTKFNDESEISYVENILEWSSLASSGYCWLNNNIEYKNSFGALYNFYTVSNGNLCPSGWHVPSDTDWKTLISYLGGDYLSGGKLKEEGTVHWSPPNTLASNETGFTGLPGGRRLDSGNYTDYGLYGFWWSSSVGNSWSFQIQALVEKPISKDLYFQSRQVFSNFAEKREGYSVRCLKDQ